MIFALQSLGAQEKGSPGSVSFSYTRHNFPSDQIIQSLAAGHRSEVRFQIRLYEPVKGILGIFGDRLIEEYSITYLVRRDPLDQSYAVLIDSEREKRFFRQEELLDFLRSLESYTLWLPSDLDPTFYILCRSQIQPTKLVPPLTLLLILRPGLNSTSSWERVSYTRVSSVYP